MTVRVVITGSAARGDGVYYFMQLRSLIVDHDVDFANEYDHFFNTRSPLTGSRKIDDIPEPDPVTRRLSIKYPVGTALALAPFYGLWHVLTGTAERFGFRVDRSGYGAPYQWAAAVGSCFYGLLSILMIYALGRRVTTAANASVAAIAMWLATPLIYYTIVDSLFSHAVSAAIVTALVYAWVDHARPGRFTHRGPDRGARRVCGARALPGRSLPDRASRGVRCGACAYDGVTILIRGQG